MLWSQELNYNHFGQKMPEAGFHMARGFRFGHFDTISIDTTICREYRKLQNHENAEAPRVAAYAHVHRQTRHAGHGHILQMHGSGDWAGRRSHIRCAINVYFSVHYSLFNV